MKIIPLCGSLIKNKKNQKMTQYQLYMNILSKSGAIKEEIRHVSISWFDGEPLLGIIWQKHWRRWGQKSIDTWSTIIITVINEMKKDDPCSIQESSSSYLIAFSIVSLTWTPFNFLLLFSLHFSNTPYWIRKIIIFSLFSETDDFASHGH